MVVLKRVKKKESEEVEYNQLNNSTDAKNARKNDDLFNS